MRIEELLNGHEEQLKDLVSNTTETAVLLSKAMLMIAKDVSLRADALEDAGHDLTGKTYVLEYIEKAVDEIERLSKAVGESVTL